MNKIFFILIIILYLYLLIIQAYTALFSFIYFLTLFNNSIFKIKELKELKSILGIFLNLKWISDNR